MILLALAAAFGTLAFGLLVAKEFVIWLLALPPKAASLFGVVSLLVSVVLVAVALMFNSNRGKAS
jgi:hypothetical protein